ncbi:hypothetical protein KDL67_10445 [bacterium]|nr:hypothetical protein [bacterium]
MALYEERQFGVMVIVPVAIVALVELLVFVFADFEPATLIGFGVMLVLLLLFGTMSVAVSASAITLRFGIGLIHRRFSVREVKRVSPARNHWWQGWGIRRLPRGWMYNVTGLDSVELEMEDGHVYRIGTRRPRELAIAIEAARGVASAVR